ILQWNQPHETTVTAFNPDSNNFSEIDLDMYITLSPNSGGLFEAYSMVAESEGRISREPQGTTAFPDGDPVEVVSYSNEGSSGKTVYLAVDHFWGNDGNIPQTSIPMEFRIIFEPVDEGIVISGVND